MLNRYKVVFTVDGKRTETVVNANCQDDAKKLVAAQYPMSKVNIINTQRL